MRRKFLTDAGKTTNGQTIRKHIDLVHSCDCKIWTVKDYDDGVVIFWGLSDFCIIGKPKTDDGTDSEEMELKNTMPLHIGAFILSISKGL